MSLPVPAPVPRPLPRVPMVVIAVLTLAAAVLGLLSWPKPARTSSGWQVEQVDGPLWTLLAVTSIVCLGAALAVCARHAGLRAGDPVSWAWAALVLLAAAALVWNCLYAAALSSPEPGPIIPVFHWLFTFAPALLAGLLFRRRGRFTRMAAALGTGVVTLPLLALSWSLLHWSGLTFGGVAASLWDTFFFGLVPFVVAVALAGAMGMQKPSGPNR